MSYPCVICGKVGLYRNGNRNYCKAHKAEAFRDRREFCDRANATGFWNIPKASSLVEDFFKNLRAKSHKRDPQ